MDPSKLQDLVRLLPVAAIVLFAPPLLQVFAGGTVFGMPSLAIYLFLTWLVLIILGGMLSRRLAQLENTQPPPESDPQLVNERPDGQAG